MTAPIGVSRLENSPYRALQYRTDRLPAMPHKVPEKAPFNRLHLWERTPMTKTFSLEHEQHNTPDERSWRITELTRGSLLIQAWPDDGDIDKVDALILKRFGCQIVIDKPTPAGVMQGRAGIGLSMINELRLMLHKLVIAGIDPAAVPPFVVHSMRVEALIRDVEPDLPDDVVEQRLSIGFGDFFGVRVSWSKYTDQFVKPAETADFGPG